jgi:hypothetical protein
MYSRWHAELLPKEPLDAHYHLLRLEADIYQARMTLLTEELARVNSELSALGIEGAPLEDACAPSDDATAERAEET